MCAYQKQFEKNTQKALNNIRSRLQALLETKPLSNKIQSKVAIFRYERTSKFHSTNLKDVSLIEQLYIYFQFPCVKIKGKHGGPKLIICFVYFTVLYQPAICTYNFWNGL